MKTFFKSQRAGTISRRSFLKNGMPGSGTVYNFGPDFMHADMGRVRQRQAWHMCSSFGLLVLLLLGSLILAGGSLHAQDDPVAAMIRQRVEKIPIKTGLKVGACRLASPSILPRLYQDRGYRPIWTKPEAVNQLITAIQESYLEGLNPQDYSLAEIRSSTGSASPSTNPSQSADRDLLLTTAFLRLAANFFLWQGRSGHPTSTMEHLIHHGGGRPSHPYRNGVDIAIDSPGHRLLEGAPPLLPTPQAGPCNLSSHPCEGRLGAHSGRQGPEARNGRSGGFGPAATAGSRGP